MAEPTEKAPGIVEFLDRFTERTRSIRTDVCIEPPFGCGRKATEFRDAISKKEYSISGLCQYCQDLLFGEE
jgi:hypothetical protein